MVQIIDRLQSGIQNGEFSDSDANKARDYAHEAAVALGNKLKDANNYKWNGFDGEEFLENSVAKLAKNEGLEGMLAPEDLAGLYVSAVKKANEKGIDLHEDFDKKREQLTQVWEDARVCFIAAKFNVPVDTVNAAIVNGQKIALARNPKASRGEKISETKSLIDQYKAKKWNGKNVRIKEEDGKVKLYFDEE